MAPPKKVREVKFSGAYIFIVKVFLMDCPGSLMDKVVDSGSTDTGSIPVRDAR